MVDTFTLSPNYKKIKSKSQKNLLLSHTGVEYGNTRASEAKDPEV